MMKTNTTNRQSNHSNTLDETSETDCRFADSVLSEAMPSSAPVVIKYIKRLLVSEHICDTQIGKISEIANRIRHRIGKCLIMIKEQLPHGQFESTIEAEFGDDFTTRSARNYMLRAEGYSEDEASKISTADMTAAARNKPGKTPQQDDDIKAKIRPLGNSVATLKKASEAFEKSAAMLSDEKFISAAKEGIVYKSLASSVDESIANIYAGVVSLWTLAGKTNTKDGKALRSQLSKAKTALESVQQSLAKKKVA